MLLVHSHRRIVVCLSFVTVGVLCGIQNRSWVPAARGVTSRNDPLSMAAYLSRASGVEDESSSTRRYEQQSISEKVSSWGRTLLASLSMALAAATLSPAAAHAAPVKVYFGQGCFWHLQHELLEQEVAVLGRGPTDVSALVGYAGGKQVGPKGEVCYHNMAMAPDYGQLGHTEVVSLALPEDKVRNFAKVYFDDAASYMFGRRDPQDMGPEYRSAIGIPGGMNGPLFQEIQEANAGRLQLLPGKGNDDDTVGTKKVWIYDSDKFPFNQGEVYHQFHDDMSERYDKNYHELKNTLLNDGRIQKVLCPERR